MATGKRGKAKDKVSAPIKEEITYIIKEASLKDDFCNYKYEITEGVGIGDDHTVKGTGIIKDDMRHAFGNLIVHLAVIDDVFKHSGIEIDDIEKFHTHDLTALYHVTGIKIKGSRENETVILIGSKHVSSAGGRIDIATPKVAMDNFSSYKWYNELKAAVDEVRREVALYKEGKYTPVEVEEEGENPRQLKLGEDVVPSGNDDDLENTRV